MAGGGGGEASRRIDQTPTWAVAVVCTIIIVVSIALEKIIHKLGTVFLLTWQLNPQHPAPSCVHLFVAKFLVEVSFDYCLE